MRTAFFVVLAVFASLFALKAHADEIDVPALDARLKALMKERGMVGLAVAIVEDGELIHVKGYGETLASSGDPVTDETVFRWASLSKAVGATLVTKLDESGSLSLSAPAASYTQSLRLPERGERRATVQNVLSHQLGIVRNAYDNRLEKGALPGAIRSSLAGLPIQCPVGTCHAYQNVAYDSISEMVKGVTGQDYNAAVKSQIFDPIGMTSATLTLGGLENAPRWARPHNSRGQTVYRRMREHYYRVPAAGGVNSNIRDLGLWMQAQMGEMNWAISDDVREQTQRGRVRTGHEDSRVKRYYPRMSKAQYGLGWRVYEYGGRKVVGHRGAVNGYRAMILFDPDMKTGIAALWNSGSNQPVGLQFEVMDMAYGLPAQDWLYLGRGPDLRAVRRQTPSFAKFAKAPTPRLAPYAQNSGLPAGHGLPIFDVTSCFGVSDL